MLTKNCPNTLKCQNAKNNHKQEKKKMARQKARNLKNTLDHATMYKTARACGILVHVYQYLATPLASKIRLVLLVVNSVRSHLTE